MFNYKLIFTGLLTIGSVVGVREYLKPRDIQSLLKWKGLSLIANDNKNAWEASLYENAENLKKLGIESADALKNWCASKMSDGLSNESIVSGAEQYCKDSPKTVMGNIIRDGERERLIKEGDRQSSKVVYVLINDRQKLVKVISIAKDEELNYELVGDKINKWCNKEIAKDLKDAEHLSNVKRYCYDRGVKNIKELLKKQGLTPLKTEEAYKKRFKEQDLGKVKELIDQIRTALKALRGKDVNRSKGIPEDININDDQIKSGENQYFQWWCEYEYDQDLTGSGIFPETYQRVKSRCTEKDVSLPNS